MSAIGLYAVGVVIVVFGVVGFVRGWYRETLALAGLVVGWTLVLLGGKVLVTLVDRAYLMIAYAVRGGFDTSDPGGLLRQLRANPLVDPAHPEPLYAVVFAVVVVLAYGAGTRYGAAADGLHSQLLGVPVGLLNGYLLSYALLKYAAPAAIGEGLVSTADLVGRYVTLVLAAGAVVSIGLVATMLRGRGRGRPARSARARSRG